MKVYLLKHTKTTEEGLHQKDDSSVIPDLVWGVDLSNLKYEKVYSSPLLRARQTAELLFHTFEVVDFIYEAKAPRLLIGKPKEFVRKFWNKHFPEFSRDPDWKYDKSESFNEIVARAEKFRDFLIERRHKNVVVVGHGAFFRHLIGVNMFGKDYNYAKYKKWLWPMEWENLEIKEIKI